MQEHSHHYTTQMLGNVILFLEEDLRDRSPLLWRCEASLDTELPQSGDMAEVGCGVCKARNAYGSFGGSISEIC